MRDASKRDAKNKEQMRDTSSEMRKAKEVIVQVT